MEKPVLTVVYSTVAYRVYATAKDGTELSETEADAIKEQVVKQVENEQSPLLFASNFRVEVVPTPSWQATYTR